MTEGPEPGQIRRRIARLHGKEPRPLNEKGIIGNEHPAPGGGNDFVAVKGADAATSLRSNLVPFVEGIEQRLLTIRDVSQPKLHDQRIFVWLLDYPVAECVENLDRTPDNLKDLLFGRSFSSFVSIGVYSWLILCCRLWAAFTRRTRCALRSQRRISHPSEEIFVLRP